jgi:hypothetical protein
MYMKTFKGNPPEIGEIIAESNDWLIYDVPNRFEKGDEFNWARLKLVAKRPMPAKGNYWLGWSYKEQRLARSKDAAVLAQYLPDLHRWVVEQMTAHDLT